MEMDARSNFNSLLTSIDIQKEKIQFLYYVSLVSRGFHLVYLICVCGYDDDDVSTTNHTLLFSIARSSIHTMK